MGKLERGEGLSEVAVLPQQIFKEFFAGVQHALLRIKETVREAGFLASFMCLTRNSGTIYAGF